MTRNDPRKPTADWLQMKVHLSGIKPEIWRRFVVPGSLTLHELHPVLQGAMGWHDTHLSMFGIGGVWFETPSPDSEEEPELGEDARDHVVADVLRAGMDFVYVYDFGDNWHHALTVEKSFDPSAASLPRRALDLPRCIEGARACPPEDCGGVGGYWNLVEALADPEHEDHDRLSEWVGTFEPEIFSVDQANALIWGICALYRERGWGFVD